MATDGKIVIELVSKDSASQQFLSSMKTMQGGVLQFQGTAAGTFAAVGTAASGMLLKLGAAAVGVLGLAKLQSTMKSLGDEAKTLEKTAQRLGISVESLSGLQYVAKKNKVDVETLNTALAFMQKNIAATAAGMVDGAEEFDEFGEKVGKAGQAFKDLGLDAKELQKLSPEEQFLKISKAMEQYASQGDKILLTTEIMGKSGRGMVGMLMEGEAGIRKVKEEGVRFGVVIDKDMAQKMAEFSSASKRMDSSVKGLAMAFTVNLGPAIGGVVDQMTDLVTQIGKVDPQILELLLKVGGGAALGGAIGGRWGMAIGAGAGLVAATVAQDLRARAQGDRQGIPQLYPGMDVDIDPAAWAALVSKSLNRVKPPKGGGAGKAAAEAALTEVSLFEQLAWGADDAEKALERCAKRLETMRDHTERLVSGQEKYAETMAGLSPVLGEQLQWKQQAIQKELELKLLTLDRELDEKKINQAIYDQEKGMAAVVNQAKLYALEREKWQTQGIMGGLQMGAFDVQRDYATFAARSMADLVKAVPKELSQAMASGLINFLRGRKTDFTEMGWRMAEGFLQKGLEGLYGSLWSNFLKMLGFGIVTPSEVAANVLAGGGQAAGMSILSYSYSAAAVLRAAMTGGGAGVGGLGGLAGLFGGGGGNPYEGWGWLSSAYKSWTPTGLASGGIALKPMLAQIAEDGPEAVIPLDKLGGAPQINLTVINNLGVGAEARASQGPDGSLEITLSRLNAQDVNRGGPFSRALENTYGLRRRTAGR